MVIVILSGLFLCSTLVHAIVAKQLAAEMISLDESDQWAISTGKY